MKTIILTVVTFVVLTLNFAQHSSKAQANIEHYLATSSNVILTK